MSVCRYYLRGYCRNENRCPFPHVNPNEPRVHPPSDPSFRPRHPRPPIKSDYKYVAPSLANKNHHVQNTTASAKQPLKYADVFAWVPENFADKEKALDILAQLQKEAKILLKSSHFWRFTSRSLFPGGQPLEDWRDVSFEELKWIHRLLISQDREHVYKKDYGDYLIATERHLQGLANLRLETLISLKDYINQYVVSVYKPSKTLSTDIEMKDISDNITSNFLPQIESTNYTPDDQLLEDERAAFESDTFEFGQIPVHAPPKELC